MAQIDKFLSQMAGRSATKALLAAEQPSQVFLGDQAHIGAAVSRVKLEQILREVMFSAQSAERLQSQDWVYKSPSGAFIFRLMVSPNELKVRITPQRDPSIHPSMLFMTPGQLYSDHYGIVLQVPDFADVEVALAGFETHSDWCLDFSGMDEVSSLRVERDEGKSKSKLFHITVLTCDTEIYESKELSLEKIRHVLKLFWKGDGAWKGWLFQECSRCNASISLLNGVCNRCTGVRNKVATDHLHLTQNRSTQTNYLGIAGALTLGVGIFLPVIDSPLLGGSVGYLQLFGALSSDMLPALVGGSALLSLLLAAKGVHKALWLTGALALGAVGFSLKIMLWLFQDLMQSPGSSTWQNSTWQSSTFFQQLVGRSMPHLEWGWAFLFGGGLLLLAAAARAPQDASAPKKIYPKWVTSTWEMVGALGAIGFWLLLGLNNTLHVGLPTSIENAVRFAPGLGTAKIDSHDVYACALRLVREKLPANVDAKFPGYDDYQNRSMNYQDPDTWTISGYVKYSPDGSGIMERYDWTAQMHLNRTDYSWQSEVSLTPSAPPEPQPSDEPVEPDQPAGQDSLSPSTHDGITDDSPSESSSQEERTANGSQTEDSVVSDPMPHFN